MEINYNNKSSFEFYQSIYDRGVKEIEPISQLALADKFHYFRLYQSGKYFLFPNQEKYSETMLFSSNENGSTFTKFIKSVPINTGRLYAEPLSTSDRVMNLIDALGWQYYCIFYFRHKDYIDALTLCGNIDKVAHRQ